MPTQRLTSCLPLLSPFHGEFSTKLEVIRHDIILEDSILELPTEHAFNAANLKKEQKVELTTVHINPSESSIVEFCTSLS